MENRIKEIKLEKDVTFRYVATDCNPSDYATRGLSVKEMMCSLSWWHGPSWDQNDDASWSNGNFSDLTPEVLQRVAEEVRKAKPTYE